MKRLARSRALLALAACAATQQSDAVAPDAPGFLLGLWHGLIFPLAWIVSLFVPQHRGLRRAQQRRLVRFRLFPRHRRVRRRRPQPTVTATASSGCATDEASSSSFCSSCRSRRWCGGWWSARSAALDPSRRGRSGDDDPVGAFVVYDSCRFRLQGLARRRRPARLDVGAHYAARLGAALAGNRRHRTVSLIAAIVGLVRSSERSSAAFCSGSSTMSGYRQYASTPMRAATRRCARSTAAGLGVAFIVIAPHVFAPSRASCLIGGLKDSVSEARRPAPLMTVARADPEFRVKRRRAIALRRAHRCAVGAALIFYFKGA